MKLHLKHQLLFIVLLTIPALIGCSSDSDRQLERIDNLSEKDPLLSRAALDSIDPESLSTPDRHLYDLLTVKVKDKNFIRHASDSLILDVLKYYSSHKNSPRYPEALYYAGRVYSDLGDLPKAIDYFQQTLDCVNGSNIERAKILTQTAEILVRLRLYNEAKTYLSESIEIDKNLGNKINLLDDLNMLGFVYTQKGDVDSALMMFDSVLRNNDTDATGQRMEAAISVASIETQRGNTHKALPIVRQAVNNSDSISRNFILANAAYIYMKAGVYDTAYIYSHKIVSSKDPNNKKAGYAVMLSPSLRHFLPADSIDFFFNDYKNVLEDFYDRHESQEAIARQTQYNYEMQVREKEKAKELVSNLLIGLALCLILILLAGSIVFYQKNRNKTQYIKLMETLSRLAYLENLVSSNTSEQSNKTKPDNQEETGRTHNSPKRLNTAIPGIESLQINNRDQLRQALRDRLLSIKCTREDARLASSPLFETAVYARIMKLIENDKPISDSPSMWKGIENSVVSTFPNLRENIKLLSDGNLSRMEYHILLLMKFCLSPVQIAGLICKTKSNVSYYRNNLCRKLFDKNNSAIDIDILIALL